MTQAGKHPGTTTVAEGATVVANTLTPSDALEQLSATGDVQIGPGDITESTCRDRLVAAAGGRIDILVNNAGVAPVAMST